MKIYKNMWVAICLIFATFSYAEIAEVYTWEASPGKNQEMIANMTRAAEIHRSQGAQVSINVHDVGSTQLVDYVIRRDDMGSYAETKDAQMTSVEWQEFWSDVSSNPVGTLSTSFSAANLDQTKMASDFNGSYVYSVSVWDNVETGKVQQLLENFQTAKAIIEESGARVEIYTGGHGSRGQYHFVLLYDSWSSLTDSFMKLGQSQDWMSFMQETSSENIADEIRYFTGYTVN